jgi:Mrp family chromosome partitioning ATPase
VDVPAVIEYEESIGLSEMVDGMIMVVEAGKPSPELVKQAAESVSREKLLGVVLNRARSTAPRWLSRIVSREAPSAAS